MLRLRCLDEDCRSDWLVVVVLERDSSSLGLVLVLVLVGPVFLFKSCLCRFWRLACLFSFLFSFLELRLGISLSVHVW